MDFYIKWVIIQNNIVSGFSLTDYIKGNIIEKKYLLCYTFIIIEIGCGNHER